MTDRALIVVSRVAAVWKGRAPTEQWVANREHLLRDVAAAAMSDVKTPLVWVWRVTKSRQDQAREIADRVWPDAVIVNKEATLDDVWPDRDRFITFRLDSDDAWIPAEIDRWANTELEDSTLVNFGYGWQLDWADGRVANSQWQNPAQQGPFLAVTHESRDRMFGVGGNHATEARASRKHVVHVRRRSWVQVVHEGNIKNVWRGYTPFEHGGELWQRVFDRSGIRWEKPAE